MRDFSNFKVQVVGGPKPVEERKVVNQIVSVNMKTNKVDAIIPEEETDNSGYFKALRGMVAISKMSIEDAAHMAILEIKRVFVECISDNCTDVQTVSYLDGLIFNTMEKFIAKIIESSIEAGHYASLEYKEVLNGSIKNSVKLLGYEDDFNYEKMFWVVDQLITDFSK